MPIKAPRSPKTIHALLEHNRQQRAYWGQAIQDAERLLEQCRAQYKQTSQQIDQLEAEWAALPPFFAPEDGAECPYCGGGRVFRAGDVLQCRHCKEQFVRLLPDQEPPELYPTGRKDQPHE